MASLWTVARNLAEYPSREALAAQADTLFKGETLRGLLLTSYAFWTLGTIAGPINHLNAAPGDIQGHLRESMRGNRP
jgi:hypothetical protein